MSPEPPPSAGKAWPAWVGLAVLLTLLALAHTWPLAAHWNRAIPYVYHPSPGWELVPEMPGDHLQFYYWSWLFVDNLTGASHFPSNPYEFNTWLNPQGTALYANFPFSLLYLACRPLGALPAYNTVVLLSYLLTGLAAWALGRRLLGSGLAALPLALIYALLPFRVSQALSGHLYGYIAFLLPATLWLLEEGWARRSWLWGALGGLCLLAMGLMEGHLLFYSTLALVLYVPLRMLTRGQTPSEEQAEDSLAPAGWVGGAGLALGLSLHLAATRGEAGLGWSSWPISLGLGLVLLWCLWLVLAWLARGLTRLGPAQARALLARGLAPLILSPLYAVQFFLDVPHLGKVIVAALLLWGAVRCVPALWQARRLPSLPQGAWPPLIALGLGWVLGVAAMLVQKARVLDDSIAAGGRSLGEVKLFAPHLADLARLSPSHAEQIVYLGLVLLVLAGAGLLLMALGRRGAGDGPLWAVLGVLAALLCLGPNLPQLPLYAWLYDHVPFFNYPRVPGRMVIFAVLFLGLLGGWCLQQIMKAGGRRKGLAVVLGLAVVGLVAWDFWPPSSPGLCLLPPPGALAQGVKAQAPTGPKADQRVLGLPLWPGDSHQSSAYELLISRTRAKMVNGYSPQVSRAYVDQIFWPLYPLDFGWVTPKAREVLQRLKVGLVAFYEDEEVYTRKVSPFPPELARRRLVASGLLKPSLQAGNVWLLKPSGLRDEPKDATGELSPITSLWEAAWLRGQTGRLKEDREASGWGLLFAEAAKLGGPLGPRLPKATGNVRLAVAGKDQPGWLSRGPGRPFPPGLYVARFRLRRGPGEALPGYVEVCDSGTGRLLAKKALTLETLPADGAWHEVEVAFELDGVIPLDLRAWFSGKANLELDLVLVNFAGMEQPQIYYPASRLWRQTGELVADPRVPTNLAVRGRAHFHPPLYLMHGPQQTYEPGSYVARFSLAAEGSPPPEALLATLVVATDLGRRRLGLVRVRGRDLDAGYQIIEVSFELTRRAELGFRVLFGQGGTLRVAGVSVQRKG